MMTTGPTELTREAARAEITETLGNSEHPYQAKHTNHPSHDESVARMTKLFAIAYPEEPGEEAPQAGEGEESIQAKGIDEIPLPAMPEGLTWDKNTLGDFNELANALEIPQATATRVLELEAECWRQEPPTSEESMAQLQEQWGSETDRKVYAARWFVQNFVSAPLQAALERSGLGDHPEMVMLCAEEGERRLAELQRDKLMLTEIGKHTPGSPEYEAAVAKRGVLYRKIYGTKLA